MTREDLKDGEIYIIKEWCDYLFKFLKINENDQLEVQSYINIEKPHFNGINFNRSLTYNCNFEYLKATPEQKHWLLECEKADKFIPYDEAMKTFVKEWQLPEKWCIKSSKNSDIHKWFETKLNRKVVVGTESFFHYPEYYFDSCTSPWIEIGYTEITLQQFKQHVFKENKLPYTILKQEGDKILQVSNQEGSIFDIGDIVQSLNMKKYQIIPLEIIGFRFNKANDGIIAVCNKQTSNGISIDKIEHYIELKEVTDVKLSIVGEVEESLLDKAKRLYPIGTKYIHPESSFGRYKYIVKDPNNFSKINDNTIYGEPFKGCIVLNGKWAEIVEEVKSDNSVYEILSFKSDKDTLTTLRDNGYYVTELSEPQNCPNGLGATKVQMLTDWDFRYYKIHSVKQLSTGKVFTVGDKIKTQYYEAYITLIRLTENNFIQFQLEFRENNKIYPASTVLLQNALKIE